MESGGEGARTCPRGFFSSSDSLSLSLGGSIPTFEGWPTARAALNLVLMGMNSG